MDRVRILLIFIGILMASFTQLQAQTTDWKVIGGLDTVSFLVVFESNDGRLFSIANGNIYVSSNVGNDWVLIAENVYLNLNLNFNDFVERNDEIYFSTYEAIYKFDKVGLKCDRLIRLNSEILNFNVLNNGDLILATKKELLKYDQNLTKTTLFSWDYFRIKLLSKDNERIDYVIATSDLSPPNNNRLLKLNDDMTNVVTSRIMPANVNPQVGSGILGNRIIVGNQYTVDEGNNWTVISFANQLLQFSLLHIGKDNNLYYHSPFLILVSSDLGVTFTEIRLPQQVPILYFINANQDGDITIGYTLCGSDAYAYQYDKNLMLWSKINNNLNKRSAENFAVFLDENLVTKTRCNKVYYKDNAIIDWAYSDEIQNQLSNPKFFTLDNGEFLIHSEYIEGFLKSSDKGKTWKVINKVFNIQNIVVKKNLIFALTWDGIFYSIDFGENWTSVAFPNGVLLNSSDQYDFSSDLVIYYKFDFDSEIYSFDLKTQENKVVFSSGYNTVKTSYDGKTLYIPSVEFPDVYLNISLDNGQTFSKIKMPFDIDSDLTEFYIDYNGNLYLYGGKEVYLSQDNGVSWQNISPTHLDIKFINDLNVSFDNYLYVSTDSKGIIKYNQQIQPPNFRFITANVFSDTNDNCVKDANEEYLPNVKVMINGNFVKTTDTDGKATFFTIKDQNVIKTLHNVDYYQSCVDSVIVQIDSLTTNHTIDIPLKVLKSCVDIQQTISAQRLRRCFDNTYFGHVYNDGTTTSTNTRVKILLDPYFDFISCSAPVISHVNQELLLDIGNLSPGQFVTYQLHIKVNCTAPFGIEHCISADVVTDSQHCIDIPEGYSECQENIGSYDPNDKTIFVNGVRDQAYAIPSDKIEYMIRFQNTGTDTAFTVRIEDKIADRFDISSIRPTSSSHDYSWRLENGVLIVLFENINLVDSFTNEPLSNGFIKFDIKLNLSTRLGDDFANTAGIFFDFNDPVITNTVTTTVGYPTGTADMSVTSKIIAIPNPTTGIVHLSSDDTLMNACDITIFTIQGRKVHSGNWSKENALIDISHLAAGMYIINMDSGSVRRQAKVVKM